MSAAAATRARKAESREWLSAAERAGLGKAARRETPRSSHGEWSRAPGAVDPVGILRGQDESRAPELLPIRHGRMLVSAFTFYRGAAGIMAADLANSPTSGIEVQLCGDAHLENFGAFAASDRQLVFDLNDFDETLPGPWEWDVKRLAASLEVAGRDRGFEEARRRSIVAAASRGYREAMRRLATMRTLDVWYERVNVSSLLEQWHRDAKEKELKRFERNVAKARAKDSLRAFSKLVHDVDGERRIVSDPPLIVPLEELFPDLADEADERLRAILAGYRETLPDDRRRLLDQFEYVHAARKVVGVGSVGTRAFIALLTGRDGQDPLFLQAKEAEASVLEDFAAPSAYPHHGQRVVEGQRLMQAASDLFLGWLSAEGPDGRQRDFYVRQLWDQKGSALVDAMRPAAMAAYGELCGATLARAHARSGDRIAIAAYLGSSDRFDRAMADFAGTYADQNEHDYRELGRAAEEGRLAAEVGV